MKRVSISFVLRVSGFQSNAEVEFGPHKSHRTSSLERPRPTAALIPSKVWCGRQDRSRLTVLCPSCYFFPQNTQSKALRVFSAHKHSAISETTVSYRTTQQIFFHVSLYSYVKATSCTCDKHVYSSGLWQLLHVSTCPCYRQGGISFVLHSEYSQLLRSTVVKVLWYKSEGRWFDPSLCHWKFHWHKILPIALWP